MQGVSGRLGHGFPATVPVHTDPAHWGSVDAVGLRHPGRVPVPGCRFPLVGPYWLLVMLLIRFVCLSERVCVMVSLADYSDVVRAEVKQVREVVAGLHEQLLQWGLVVWTAGNVSQRLRSADLMVIKPSGVRYEFLTPQSMVVTDLQGHVVDGEQEPSSDTASHAYIYRHMPDVFGVVHTHSTYATAWAAAGRQIPCALTMMGDEFGGPVPVGPFRLIGSEAIGRGVVETLARYPKSPAVLMRNHGPFTVGGDAESAVKAAAMTEEVARTVWAAEQLGGAVEIAQKDIDSLNDRYQNVYGQH